MNTFTISTPPQCDCIHKRLGEFTSACAEHAGDVRTIVCAQPYRYLCTPDATTYTVHVVAFPFTLASQGSRDAYMKLIEFLTRDHERILWNGQTRGRCARDAMRKWTLLTPISSEETLSRCKNSDQIGGLRLEEPLTLISSEELRPMGR